MGNQFDKAIASRLIAPAITRLRALSYGELKEKVVSGEVETGEIEASNGDQYQFELLFYWDGKPEEDIRVIASIFIDPRGPNVNESFIKARDGRFVGENNAT